MTNDEIGGLIDTAIAATQGAIANLQQARAALGTTTTTPPPIRVTAGKSLQPIIDQAPAGARLELEPATYVGCLKLTKPITIAPSTPIADARASAIAPVTIRGEADADTIDVRGDQVLLAGIAVRHSNPDFGLVNIAGGFTTLDRVTALGDPTRGQHIGFRLHGSDTIVQRCYVDDVFAFGRDTTAAGGWDGGARIVIDDSYLSAGAETVMFGGADSASADRVPRDISITRSRLTKNPAWFARGVQIKNALELKSAVNVKVQDCVLEYAGISGGQGGYLIVLTVRNQDGAAPWSTIQNVVIERCLARYGGGGANILGLDDSYKSVRMSNVTLRQIKFANIDPQGITKGDAREFMIGGAPNQLTLEAITVEAQNMNGGSQVYLNPPFPTQLVLRNLKLAPAEYGLKIDAGGMGLAAFKAAMPDAILEQVGDGAGATTYPTV